ncbi:MAG: hypothetical protein IPM54_16275 [Polyangiaceae bacterium]|nr:hypothetical protein [Polyangiaceae bacterium]
MSHWLERATTHWIDGANGDGVTLRKAYWVLVFRQNKVLIGLALRLLRCQA